MAECPWCHGPVRDVRAPCPNCGKLASDLRATDPPEPLEDKNATAAEVPDLVIPSAPTSKPVSKAPVPAAPPVDADDMQLDLGAVEPPKPGVARPPTPGAGFSPFDDDFAAGPSLELDTVGGSLPPRISNPPSVPQPAAPISQRVAPPGPPAPEPVKPAVDAFDAKAYADYGPRPSAFWHTPLYAYRVIARRAALRRDLAAKKTEAERTQKRVDDALVSLGERARALAKGGAAALDKVRTAEELLRNRDGALAGAMDSHRAALAEIDARLGPAEGELARAREEESRVAAAREAAEEDCKRAEAKVKRLDIEIRNGQTGKAAERDAAAAEAAQKDGKRADAEAKLQAARRAVLAAQAKVDAVTRERGAQDARFSRQSGTRSAGVDDAQTHLRAALVELGRAMLSDPSLAAELAPARDEVARLEDHARKQSQELALHESALTAYDAPQVFLGVALVGLALLLLLGVVFFPVIYRSFVN